MMSTFWSIVVTAITVFTLVGCAYLLWWCWTDKMGVEEGKSMGHEFDGIEEVNNPLPKWWSYMFILTLVFAVIYLALYPGLGNFSGLFGWKSADKDFHVREGELVAGIVQYDRELKHADKVFGPVFQKFAQRDAVDLAYDSEAYKIGQRLFLQNCAQCHGSDARGSTGFPNLTDNNWLYGGTTDAIKHTLLYGRQGIMPNLNLSEESIRDLTSYVLSMSGRKVNEQEAARGKAQFAMCAACHGMDGKGSLANGLPMGAPNLTDNVWLYGGSRKAVEDTLRNGRNGVMPAWKDILGEDKIHLITAYVYRQSNPKPE